MKHLLKPFVQIALKAVLGIFLLLSVFHILRTATALENLNQRIVLALENSAADIDAAARDVDVFQIKRILTKLAYPGVTYSDFVSVQNPKPLIFSRIISGNSKDHLLMLNYKFKVENKGFFVGTVNLKVDLLTLSKFVLFENFLTYLSTLLIVVLIVTFIFKDLLSAVVKLDRYLNLLSSTDLSTNYATELTNWLTKSAGYGSSFHSIYATQIKRIFLLLQTISSKERENEVLRAQADVAAQIAHDIRSPISALNIALSPNLIAKAEAQSLAKEALVRINAIAEWLLNFSRDITISTAKINGLTDLNHVSQSIINEKTFEYKNSGVEFDIAVENNCAVICQASATEISRILSNLINNAVESIEGTGKVAISLNSNNKIASMTVTDTGSGIPKDLFAKIGTKGFSTKSKGRAGSGLGVHHAKTYIEQIGGKFLISSSHRGTEVLIELPLA